MIECDASTANVYPWLRYKDAPAAIEWLVQAFGFEKQLVVPGGPGQIVHAQLRLGPGIVMLGSTRDDGAGVSPIEIGGTVTGGVSVRVSDPDAHYARAKAAAAEILHDIADNDYGGRGYSARDPEGHLWNFSSYDPMAGT